VPDLREQLNKSDNVYIDGENNLAYWTGESDESARDTFFY
jgi:arylsulfatase